ncbi:MAG: prepilin-type N-terminal cleavage/methylation domain-containing protein [Clostridiaceae bacterium]|nr:prepilin-type N-terminal cleavage/methylation domain-containing protein [Clostridiaceae bacterium]
MNQKKRNNKGFSLVELIIVIAIMAVLVAVLAPQYIKYVEKSRVSKDLVALDEVLRAAQVAAVDPASGATTGEITVAINDTSGVVTLTDVTGQETHITDDMGNSLGTVTLTSKNGKALADLTIIVDLTTGVKWQTAPSIS